MTHSLFFHRAKYGLSIALLISTLSAIPYIMSSAPFHWIALNHTEGVKRTTPFQLRGSIPYWDQENAVASFKANVDQFSSVSVFWYYLTNTGKIDTYQYAKEDRELIDFAHAHDVKVLATITNLSDSEQADWDSKRVERMLRTPESRQRHIRDIEQKLELMGFDGVSIDYEEVAERARDNFSQFIAELADALHQNGKIVAVALHPKSGERIPIENNGSYSQDWKQLAESADHLYIMAYGEHWDGSEPGPVASIGWVKRIIRYVESLNVPTEKFYLGVPLYGQAWDVDNFDNSDGLTYKEIADILKRFSLQAGWDDEARSPYFRYSADNTTYEVWFENAASVREKALLAYEANFAGVSFWRLGGEDQDIWTEPSTFKLETPSP